MGGIEQNLQLQSDGSERHLAAGIQPKVEQEACQPDSSTI